MNAVELFTWVSGPVLGGLGTAFILRRTWNRDSAELIEQRVKESLLSKIMHERDTAAGRAELMMQRYEELLKIHLEDSVRMTKMVGDYESMRVDLKRVRREGAKLDPTNTEFMDLQK